MAKEIKGVIVPIVTPFHADETINEQALRQIVDYLIDNGVHGLFPVGSQGEFFALTIDEKKRVMDIVLNQAAGRVVVMPGTGAVTTRESVELTRYAEAAGADAVSAITPYFIKPTNAELGGFYLSICEAVDIPVLAYNNPGRTGVSIAPEVAASVAAQAPNFQGIKDSSGDLSNTMSYIAQCPFSFKVFIGRDTLIYAGLCYECAGAVAASANVVPELVVGIYDAFQAGNDALAWERQQKLAPLRRAFSLASFPVIVKDAMEMIGLPAGPCRAPIRSVAGPQREALRQVLVDLGKL